MNKDLYETLGVGSTADEAMLKAAFRKKAMEFHPDRNPGNKEAEANFKDINHAYEILKDPQKRAAYDRYGHAAFQNGGTGQSGNDGFGSSMSDIFEDLFGNMMGGGRQRGGGAGRERGSDLRYNLEITLEEAFHGKTSSIKVPTAITCEACTGSGAKPGSKPKVCATCAGQGRVRAQQGFFAIERTCHVCQGRGQTIDDPCATCKGNGRVTRERQLSVNIPTGVEDGTRIRLSGEGEGGLHGGPAGDLYIFLAVKPHPFFQRDGADLYCRVPVSMVQASLGGEFSLRGLDGAEVRVKIPEGTQSARQFRLKAKGMPILRSRNLGDLHVQVDVETPQNLTRRQRELLAEFEKESSTKTHPESAGFFTKMKDLFEKMSGT